MTNEEVFKQLVIADVKKPLSQRDALLQQPNQWRTVLVGLIQDVNRQMAQNRVDLDVEWLERGDDTTRLVDYKQWKSAAVGFKTKVETRLSECKEVLRTSNNERDSSGLELITEIRDLLTEIRDAVKEPS